MTGQSRSITAAVWARAVSQGTALRSLNAWLRAIAGNPSSMPVMAAPTVPENTVSIPPLSGSRRLGLSEDAGGCDVGSCGLAVDVALLRGWFGLARVGRELTRQDVVGEPCQTCGHRSWIGIAG